MCNRFNGIYTRPFKILRILYSIFHPDSNIKYTKMTDLRSGGVEGSCAESSSIRKSSDFTIVCVSLNKSSLLNVGPCKAGRLASGQFSLLIPPLDTELVTDSENFKRCRCCRSYSLDKEITLNLTS